MTFWGADPEQLEILAAHCGQCADLLDRQRERVGWQAHHATWHGREGDHFRYEWDHFLAQRMLAASRFLRDAGDQLRRNATQQRRASSAGGGHLGAIATGWRPVRGLPGSSAVLTGAGAAGAVAYRGATLYRALHVGQLGASSTRTVLRVLPHNGTSSINSAAGTLGRASTVFGIWADSYKVADHALRGDTHDLAYDALWLGVDGALLAIPALAPVGLALTGGKLLWHFAADDPKVMAKVHEAGSAIALHHYRSASSALVHSGGQLGTDLGARAVTVAGDVAQRAARFLSSPVGGALLAPLTPFTAAPAAFRFLQRHH